MIGGNALPELPVRGVLSRLAEVLATNRGSVLHAPPGAGKTTLVPLALREASWLAGQSILVLEPRRLAARAAAGRMAQLLNEEVGETVGYRIRFDQRVSRRTRIEVLTEGILTRRLQGDPALTGVGLVVFDEFHERSLDADLALALCLDVAQGLREDLRLLVMSATLEVDRVARLLRRVGLGGEVVATEGRSFPVEMRYLPRDPEGDPVPHVVGAVRRAFVEQQSGDVLAFLPGGGEIRRAQEMLAQVTEWVVDLPSGDRTTTGTHQDRPSGGGGVVLHALYGDLSQEAQDQALRSDHKGRRKVVLATPIAETSLTIEGVRVVVDAGLARVPRFDPGSGLTRLETVRISQSSAAQRAGRAGRLGPGVCYRLWSESTQQSLALRTSPEVLSADLAGLVLELAQWGVDPIALEWLDPLPSGALAQARELLQALDALDELGRITAVGRALAELPLHPRLAHLLREAQASGYGELAADVAAILSGRDLLRTGMGRGPERSCDLSTRLEALVAFRRGGRNAALAHGADPFACSQAEATARQLRSLVMASPAQGAVAPTEVGRVLALAYPDRIAGRRSGETGRYLLSGGRGVRLALGDPMGRYPFLVAAHLDAGRGEGVVHLAAPIDLVDLREVLAAHCQTLDRLVWDEATGTVLARREERLGELLLESRPLARPDPEAVRNAMLEGIRIIAKKALSGGQSAENALDVLPWTPELREWQARVLSLRGWRAEEGWPDVSDGALMESLPSWLGPFLDGVTRRDHLVRVDLAAALHGHLSWEQTRHLDLLAPTHLAVPSGSRLRLSYTPGEAPVLAVKLQELFGLGDMPRIAGGRVAVTLHLLSPARRPIQVTQDLRSFWERTYPEVKKELKGRYPKHSWPDDPWTAAPTARAKPRQK
ncbi:ATP-dependent RNA helicase HrpB [Gammaproteobacteria bacterium]